MYLGIDLGTSNSAIAGISGGRVKVFKTPEGTDIMPSVVYRDRRGNQTVGVRAYDQIRLAPDNTVSGFKRLMGTDTPLTFASLDQSITPEHAATEILRTLVGYAMVEAGAASVSGTVVTIPAAFNQLQSEATLAAARAVGLERVALLQEPVAAALAAMAGAERRSGLFLIYDFGGGTFDAALVHAVDGEVSVLAHEGVNMLGGRDMDRGIMEEIALPWLSRTFHLPTKFAIDRKYGRLVRMARNAAEIAKISLSTNERAAINASDEEVRLEDLDGQPIYIDIPLARDDIERLAADAIDRSIQCCRKMISDVGYRSEDIGRVVLIGGPTKMPVVRRMVQERLGIEVEDVSRIDPMTAVAIGAAIYCESRDWRSSGSAPKELHRRESAGAEILISYDFEARTAANKSKLRISQTAGPSGVEIQVESMLGWATGRRQLSGVVNIELPLQESGSNRFRATVYGPNGMPIVEASREIVVERTLASTAGVPASQAIAAKILNASGQNTLDFLVHRGELLPKSGVVPYRLAHPIKAGSAGRIRIELFQVADERVVDPALNLPVGEFQISSDDLPEARMLHRGDEVKLHWFMSEGQEITCEVELPSVQQRFDRQKFYNWQLGKLDFSGEAGSKLVCAQLEDADRELEAAEETVPPDAAGALPDVRRRLDKLQNRGRGSEDADERRRIVEETRLLRQDIAILCLDPRTRRRLLARDLASQKNFYERDVRGGASQDQVTRFDTLSRTASSAIEEGSEASLELARELVDEINKLYWFHGIEQVDFCVREFLRARENRHLAEEPMAFDKCVAEGDAAIESGDGAAVRRACVGLILGMKSVGNSTAVAELASVMRY